MLMTRRLFRLLFVLLCLGLAAGYVAHGQRSGRLARVDEWFLDLMTANARTRFQQTRVTDEVVLVEFREDQRAEFSAWPPLPLDWQLVLKQLQVYQPEVLVVAAPLYWGRPAPDFVPAVAQALLPFPSVVLGVLCQIEPPDAPPHPAFLGDLQGRVPAFQRIRGEAENPTRLSAVVTAPDELLRNASELGLLTGKRLPQGGWSLAYSISDGVGGMLPTLLAQTAGRYSQSSYTLDHKLLLGLGAGALLKNGVYVPLEKNGDFMVSPADSVPTVNALDLMAGDLADVLSDEDQARLDKAKIIVLGLAEAGEGSQSMAAAQAAALNKILSMPRLQAITGPWEWALWAAAAGAGLWLAIRVRPSRVLLAAAGVLFTAFVAAYLSFQASLIWISPAVPGALILTGAFLGRFVRSRQKRIAEPEAATSEEPHALPPPPNNGKTNTEAGQVEKEISPATPALPTQSPAPAATLPSAEPTQNPPTSSRTSSSEPPATKAGNSPGTAKKKKRN